MQLFGSSLGFAVLKKNLSLLKGLEFTPAASATTKGDIYVSGAYTKLSFSFSVWWDIPTSAFLHARVFCFRVNRLFHNWMKPSNTTTSGKATKMIASICTFPRLPCPSTKRHVMLNLTSAAAAAATALRTAGWSCSVFFLFFFQHSWKKYMKDVVQNRQKRSGYDQGTTMRKKKHVSRDSKMCCCCHFCCGAPTTDERIHAPVLYDASLIDCCRHWGRASLRPITSSIAGVDFFFNWWQK